MQGAMTKNWIIKVNDLGLHYVDTGDKHGLILSSTYPNYIVGLNPEQVQHLVKTGAAKLNEPTSVENVIPPHPP